MSEQSEVWRNGKEISENRVVKEGGPRGKNDGNIGEFQQHQHNTAAEAQQQRVSDTTTGRGRRKKCPRCRDRSSSSSSRVKIDVMSIRSREAAKGGHQSQSPTHPPDCFTSRRAKEGEGEGNEGRGDEFLPLRVLIIRRGEGGGFRLLRLSIGSRGQVSRVQ